MKVEDALNLIIHTLENSNSCGRLTEQLRIAKITLYNYVIEKLAEDEDKKDE